MIYVPLILSNRKLSRFDFEVVHLNQLIYDVLKPSVLEILEKRINSASLVVYETKFCASFQTFEMYRLMNFC